MNYLAHALLAGPDPQWVLGSYLGDHVRGSDWRDYSPAVAQGIVLHRNIDVFTDAHPAFVRSRTRLDAPFRRYAGILLDLFFDHFLASDFSRLTGRDHRLFACTCYATLAMHRHLLPVSLARFAHYQYTHNLLVNYARRDTLARAIEGVSRRMKRPGPLAEGISQLNRHEAGLRSDFLQLFEDLQSFAAARRKTLMDEAAPDSGVGE